MTAETERLDQGAQAEKKPLIDEPLQVSYSKFSDGVKMVFLGVMEMLESIKPSQAKALVESIINREEPENAAPEKGASDANETTDATDTGTASPASPADGGVPADGTTVEKKAPASSTTITLDDITKVIVAKIKQKRSNNEAIGKLLAVYGAGKVSDLKPEKYEAFLTDISQI